MVCEVCMLPLNNLSSDENSQVQFLRKVMCLCKEAIGFLWNFFLCLRLYVVLLEI